MCHICIEPFFCQLTLSSLKNTLLQYCMYVAPAPLPMCFTTVLRRPKWHFRILTDWAREFESVFLLPFAVFETLGPVAGGYCWTCCKRLAVVSRGLWMGIYMCCSLWHSVYVQCLLIVVDGWGFGRGSLENIMISLVVNHPLTPAFFSHHHLVLF